MTEIKILKSITPSKISELQKIYFNKNELKYITLILPNGINKYSFGLLADLLGFIITIHSRHVINKVIVDADQEELVELYDHEYFYPIVSLLWNTTSFVDKHENDIKGLLRERQNNFFLKMNSLTRMKGNKFFLTMVDHLPGYIRIFENAHGFNDDESQIVKNFNKILDEYVLTFNQNNISEIAEVKNDIGAIIYELAKNTDEWGNTDEYSVAFTSSIRGVYLRFHRNNHDKLLEEYDGTPLKPFFNNPKLSSTSLNNLKQIYYLEILIYDSGVGYIDKYFPKEQLSDIEVIKMCLAKHQTSSTSNLKSKKGLGLDRILQILNNKGFLRIRTDKYCIYRDMIKDNYCPIENESINNLILEDWNNKNFSSAKNDKIQGSYINILYPFKQVNWNG
ncbi:MAG TPA: hypothetical protein PLZ32_08115 [Saprospiraceae bacterium]|nr:hypothetical protein [Saprospiraceae bacterium]